MSRLWFIPLALLLFGACRKTDEPARDFRFLQLQPFEQLEVHDRIELHLCCNPDSGLFLVWDHLDDRLDRLQALNENGRLILRDANKGRFLRPEDPAPRCTLNVLNLSSLHILDAAQVHCLDTIRSAALQVIQGSILDQELKVQTGQFFGGSDNQSLLRVSGRANIVSWSLEQGSALNARDLWCDDAYIRHYTLHDAFISPNKQLFAYLFHSGNLVCQRQAAYRMEREGPGSGQILIQP
jgi:hypothetical protein